ncbi:MAG: hypothetical protein JWL69_5193, partial [Phycisphaerales bacterium]|nr:hypothetical protein [Phycisphaerales bacterium]
AFDSTGNLYAANYDGGTISKITPDGTVSQYASGFNFPAYVAVEVPEPSALALLCLCGLGTLARSRRKLVR